MTFISEEDVKGRLLFAVPKKGRIHDKAMALINKIGLKYQRRHRTDIAICTNLPVVLVFLGSSDIALYVSQGRADLGITGLDILAEKNILIDPLCNLNFGSCKLSLQAPVSSNIKDPSELSGKRIVTSFSHLSKQYFDDLDKKTGKKTTINYVSGSVEAACCLGLADAVVDLVETGETMRAAGLEVVGDIFSTQTVLIGNPHTEFGDLIEKLTKRVEGAVTAQNYSMIEYNVEKIHLKKALEITPGSTSATIMPLQNQEWVAVKAMTAKKKTNEIMDQLVEVHATSIVVYDVNSTRGC